MAAAGGDDAGDADEGDDAGVGATEKHACDDGLEYLCIGGTEGCADNSEMHCGAAGGDDAGGADEGDDADVGAIEKHTCDDGLEYLCMGGTEGCADNSMDFCEVADDGEVVDPDLEEEVTTLTSTETRWTFDGEVCNETEHAI